MTRILSSIAMEGQQWRTNDTWTRLSDSDYTFLFLFSCALSTRIMIMPVLSSFRLIREGEYGVGCRHETAEKQGWWHPVTHASSPTRRERGEGGRARRLVANIPLRSALRPHHPPRLWISSLRLKLYFPLSPAIRVPGPRCSSLSRKSF